MKYWTQELGKNWGGSGWDWWSVLYIYICAVWCHWLDSCWNDSGINYHRFWKINANVTTLKMATSSYHIQETSFILTEPVKLFFRSIMVYGLLTENGCSYPLVVWLLKWHLISWWFQKYLICIYVFVDKVWRMRSVKGNEDF